MAQTLALKMVEVLKELSADSDRTYSLARREWVEAAEGKVFVRVNRRVFPESPEGFTRVFDLGSIDIKPKHRRKGVFKEVLRAMEELAIEQGRAVVVENVLSDILEKALPGYGYHQVAGSNPPIFWKSLDELKAHAAPSPPSDPRQALLKEALPFLPADQVAKLAACLMAPARNPALPDDEAIYRLGRNNIKAILRAMYPGVRFSIRFSGNRNLHLQQLNIQWPDLPDAPHLQDIQKITGVFLHGVFTPPAPGSFKHQFGQVLMISPLATPPEARDLVKWRARELGATLPDSSPAPGKRPRM